jgi:DNA replication protein DnaC
MNLQATVEQLLQLRLDGMAHAYAATLQLPVQQQAPAHEMLATLVEAEKLHRQQRRSQLYLSLSKLRFDAVLPEVECSPGRNLNTDQLAMLAACNFIRQGQNILITGATGCGKSFLACALGRHACQMGYKTLYLNMNRFIEKIATAKLDGTYVKLLNQIEKIPLLILDDFGLQPLDQTLRLALLQILEDRYNKKPVIIASQLPVSNWHEYLGEPTMADAIMDRLTASAHVVDLKGESLRRKGNKH